MPLPLGFNHLGSVSIDTPPLVPCLNSSASSSLWVVYTGPCSLDMFSVHNADTVTVYLHVYDGPVKVAAFPIPPAGIVYEHPRLRIQHALGLLLSTSSVTTVAPASAGVVNAGVQTWVSGNLP